jgi:hypothetical protein
MGSCPRCEWMGIEYVTVKPCHMFCSVKPLQNAEHLSGGPPKIPVDTRILPLYSQPKTSQGTICLDSKDEL